MARDGTRDDADTATRVLDSAERLVQTRGFNGFSYADVAAELGISEGFIRFSAGLEHKDDLIEDLHAALEKA